MSLERALDFAPGPLGPASPPSIMHSLPLRNGPTSGLLTAHRGEVAPGIPGRASAGLKVHICRLKKLSREILNLT